MEGSLHILQLDPRNDDYSVSFAPYQTGGDWLESRRIHGQEGLKQYLRGMSIREDIIETKLQEIQQNQRCDIPNVILEA